MQLFPRRIGCVVVDGSRKVLPAGAAPYHCPSTNAWRQVVASSATVCRWRLWVSIHGLAQAVKTYVLSVVTNFGVTASRANQSCGYAATTKKKRRQNDNERTDKTSKKRIV